MKYLFYAALAACLIGSAFFYFLVPAYERVCSRIVSIGVCNNYGCCRIELENGDSEVSCFPAIGHQYCYSRPVSHE